MSNVTHLAALSSSLTIENNANQNYPVAQFVKSVTLQALAFVVFCIPRQVKWNFHEYILSCISALSCRFQGKNMWPITLRLLNNCSCYTKNIPHTMCSRGSFSCRFPKPKISRKGLSCAYSQCSSGNIHNNYRSLYFMFLTAEIFQLPDNCPQNYRSFVKVASAAWKAIIFCVYRYMFNPMPLYLLISFWCSITRLAQNTKLTPLLILCD